jgi:hypothetical protein
MAIVGKANARRVPYRKWLFCNTLNSERLMPDKARTASGQAWVASGRAE